MNNDFFCKHHKCNPEYCSINCKYINCPLPNYTQKCECNCPPGPRGQVGPQGPIGETGPAGTGEY